MSNVFFPILGILLVVTIPLLVFKITNIISDLKSEIVQLNRKVMRLNSESYENERTIRTLRQKIDRIQNNNLCVGATFYYPDNHDFKTELVNKRAKIVEISDGIVKSRLINSRGEFIDDNIWTGNVSNSVNYVYENQNKLKFNFETN